MTCLLMTPGPTRVPARVLEAGAKPMIHHRTGEFAGILSATIDGLRPLFGTRGTVIPVHATGRGALEGAITNYLSAGDEVVACCNGHFGEMWARIAEKFGVMVHRITSRWEESAESGQIEAALVNHPRTRAVLLVHSDTSTGVLNDVRALAVPAKKAGALVMVDAVSSLGGVPFHFDDWGVDVAVTASQKCLMSSPGLSFVAVSDDAWKAHETANLPRSYFDFGASRRAVARANPEALGTTPIHLVLQVNAALSMIHEEGLDSVYIRHQEMGGMLRHGAQELGMPLQFPELRQLSPTLTTLKVPDGVSPQSIRERLMARGILTARGLGAWEPTCIRIGHMGDIRLADVQDTLDGLGEILKNYDRQNH